MPVLSKPDIDLIRKRAVSAGFSQMRVIAAGSVSEDFRSFYNHYISESYQAEMSYLERRSERFSPDSILPGVKTFFIFLHPYRNKTTESFFRESDYKIARYAQGRDYHRLLRKKMQRVFRNTEGIYRPVVDSAPLPERYIARKAGLGFTGRSGMLINEQQGTYFFICTVLSTVEVETDLLDESRPDSEEAYLRDMDAGCGDCRACIEACPGGAILEKGLLEAEKCISYLTIEKKDRKTFSLKKKHRYVFGCDICQMVCPYNKQGVFSLLDDFTPTGAAQLFASGRIPEHRLLNGTPLKRSRHRLDVNISSVSKT